MRYPTKTLIVRPVTRRERRLFMVAVPQCITGTKRDRNFFSTLSDANKYIGDVYTFGYHQAELIRSNGGLGAQDLLCRLRLINTACKEASEQIEVLLQEVDRKM